jgi:glycerol-3-phosphate acyltransferase PlsY
VFDGMTPPLALGVATALVGAYLVGSVPWAYIIVRRVTGEDVTAHGSGNVGAMNVRRTTGSWAWFAVAMLADVVKGLVPVLVARIQAFGDVITPTGRLLADGALGPPSLVLVPMAAVAGVVLGHNYSLWMALIKRRFSRTGKGLATGAGALLAYDWRYFAVVLVVGLATIAITRYMMAGQVVAAVALPVTALVLRSPDWPFALAIGVLVYSAHHRRFVGMLRGREPKLYIDDHGPRG